MSTALVIALSLAVGGILAWMMLRHEAGLASAPTPCSRVLSSVFDSGAASTADAALLSRLLEYRDECIGDAAYVDQVRRLMLNAGQPDSARALLDLADSRKAFTEDESKAQRAWVDMSASHLAWTNGMESRAKELHASAVSAANELRGKWPEWSLPYRILEEAGRSNVATTATAQATDSYQLERSARGRVLTGAFVRGLGDPQAAVVAFLLGCIGTLGLCAGVSGLLEMREMTRMTTSTIAGATPGYVELKGTLHLLGNVEAVIGPHSNNRGVWYELTRRSGLKGASTSYERSLQQFALRDASGEAVIDPKDMTVRTRHVVTTSGSSGAASNRRVTERMLEEGDAAYVLGELSVTTTANGKSERALRTPKNGRRLMVSTFSEEQLLLIARLWLWIGASVFVLAITALLWAYHQRYQVIAVPGVLR